MSRTVCVVVLCPYGRREPIKVTPNTSILQILEEACMKQTLNPEEYDICHYNKPLDLSLPIRFANLPNNALLELNPIKTQRVESVVTVGLQLESGERLMKDFSPSCSLWNVMEQCLSLRSEVPMQDDAGGEPVCIYMRQKLTGSAIRNTTLRSLGLTKGKAIIRLLYRQPDELQDQAHVSTPLTKPLFESSSTTSRECDVDLLNSTTDEFHVRKQPRLELDQNSPSVSHSVISESANPGVLNKQDNNSVKNTSLGKVTNTCISKNIISASEPAVGQSAELEDSKCISAMPIKSLEDDEMETNEAEEKITIEEIGNINYIGERHAVLYNLEDITDVKKADLPDEFFELTISDVKYLMEEYKRTRLEIENQPLMIGIQRQNKLLQQLAYYRQTVIRVYFPEKLVLQAVFLVEETVESVTNFIRNFLENEDLNFYLYITPPKEKLPKDRTLLEAALVPAANVYFGCEAHKSSYLIKELRSKISDPRAAALAASDSRKSSLCDTPLSVSISTTDDSFSEENARAQSVSHMNTQELPMRNIRTSQEKMPKWLKLRK